MFQISAWLSNHQNYDVVKKSLVVLEVEYVTTATQYTVVCVNTAKDLRESTRSVQEEF